MSDPKPDPLVEKNGLPYCRDECALFDGKRCRATGFRPGTLCEPAVTEALEERAALKARVAELESVRVEQAVKLRRHIDELAEARGESNAAASMSVGGRTLYFELPEAAGLPGRGVLVEWGDGIVSAGLDGGPLVRLPSGSGSQRATIEAPPPPDLLDASAPGCRHTRRNLRPNPHGVPVTTCIDCGEDLSP